MNSEKTHHATLVSPEAGETFVVSRAALYPATMTPKRSETVNFRISEEGKDLLYQLQDYYGVSQSSVFEMLLRDRARELGLAARVKSRRK